MKFIDFKYVSWWVLANAYTHVLPPQSSRSSSIAPESSLWLHSSRSSPWGSRCSGHCHCRFVSSVLELRYRQDCTACTLWVWLESLNTMLLRFILTVYTRVPCFVFNCWVLCRCVRMPSFSVPRWWAFGPLGWFQFGVMSKAAVSVLVHIFYWHVFYSLCHVGGEFLGPRELCKTLLCCLPKSLCHFSATPECQLLHVLISIWRFMGMTWYLMVVLVYIS